MNKVFKVGLIGCGHISETYFRAQEYFNNIRIVKCAAGVVRFNIISISLSFKSS